MSLNASDDGSGYEQDTSVEYEKIDGNRISPPGNITKENDLEGNQRTTEGRMRQVGLLLESAPSGRR